MLQYMVPIYSKSNKIRLPDSILRLFRRELPMVATSISCLHHHSQSSRSSITSRSEAWFVKVVITLCIHCSTKLTDVFSFSYFHENLSPAVAFEVIKLLSHIHRKPRLSFDFFKLTRTKLGLVHSPETYNMLLTSLCQLGVHDLAKLVIRDMKLDGHLPDGSFLDFLVLSFAKAGDFDIAKQLLCHAQSENVRMPSYVYNNFLSLLMMRNRVKEAVCFFREQMLRSQCYRPDICAFNIIIRGLCRVGEVEQAFDSFSGMGNFGCLPDIITYNTLVNGFCRVNKTDRGLGLLREVQSTKDLFPNVITYTSLISGYCKLGKMEAASNIFHEMFSYGVEPSLVTFNVLIDGFGKNSDMPSALHIYEKMLCLGCRPDVVTFTSLIYGHCHSGQLDQGLRCWREMNERKCLPNLYTFSVLINALCKKNMISEARDFLRQLRWREDIVPQPFIYNPVIDGFCKSGDVDEAVVVVTEMEAKKCNPDRLTYTILIIGHCMKGRMYEGINIFKKMLEAGCAPDRITIHCLMTCLLKAGMPDEAFRVKQAAVEGKYGYPSCCLMRDCFADASGLLARTCKKLFAVRITLLEPVAPMSCKWQRHFLVIRPCSPISNDRN